MSTDAMFNFHSGAVLLLCGLFSLVVPFGWAQHRSNKGEEFSCPEEFGYYPHPTDCTQYYVCVFGGALLESCTGGLMYSHDLQTCDWPRNVGCGASASSSAAINNANGVNGVVLGTEELRGTNGGSSSNVRQTTPSWKHEALQPQQDEIPDRHLYEEEDLGPVEEIENDRQQRVYRGQPPTLGQVARDRDGIIRHVNALQTSSGPEKVKPVAVLSFSPHHQSLREQDNATNVKSKSCPQNTTTNVRQQELERIQTNRVRRDVVSRNDPKFEDSGAVKTEESEIKKGGGGYALRYRPFDAANSSSVSIDLLPSATATTSVSNVSDQKSSSLFSHSLNTTPQIHIAYSTTSPKPFVPVPTRGQLASSQGVTSRYRPFLSFSPRPPPSNPAHSGSSNVHTFTKVEDNPLVVSDFSYVNVAPKSHLHPPVPRSRFPASYEPHASNFRPQYHPHPIPQAAAVPPSTFYHPHYFNQMAMHPYYGAVGPPHPFYPPPPPIHPAYQHYTPPETSIVTLTYPNGAPNSSQASTTEGSARAQVASTTSTTEKVAEASSNVNVTESKTRKRKVPKDELDDDEDEDKDEDEQLEEPEPDEEQGSEDFVNQSQETVTTSAARQNEMRTKQKHEEAANSEDEEMNDHDDTEEEPAETEDQEEESPEANEENDDGESVIELLSDEHEPSRSRNENKLTNGKPAARLSPAKKLQIQSEIAKKLEISPKHQPKEPKKASSIPVSFSTFYRRYLTDKYETPFSNADFDLLESESRMFSAASVPPANQSSRPRVSRGNYGLHRSFPPHHHHQPNNNPTTNHSSNQTTLARKNDNILTLQIYDELPGVLLKSTRAAKPAVAANKRVVPLAVVHTYRPANYSYPNKNRYRLPPSLNWNSFHRPEKPNVNFKSSFLPQYINSQFSSYPYQSAPKFGPHNASHDEAENCEGSECEEYTDEAEGEEEEPQNTESADNQGDAGKENEEYYDDYSNDYSSDDHLKEPLTKPVMPFPPPRIRNIDSEVTAPPIKDEEEQEDEGAEEAGEGEDGDHTNEEQHREEELPQEEGEEEQGPAEEEEEQEQDDNPPPPKEEIEETSVSVQKLRKPRKQVASAASQHHAQQNSTKHTKNKKNEGNNNWNDENTVLPSTPTASKIPNPNQKKLTSRNTTSTTTTSTTTTTLSTPTFKLKQDREKFKPRLLVKPKINLDAAHSYPFIKPTITPSITLPYNGDHFTSPKGPNNSKIKQKQIEVERQQINYQQTNTKPTHPQKNVAGWPPSQAPSFIIQQSVSPLPTTTKAVYNVTKFEPYYSVYDEDPEVYRDIDYSQFQNQKKVPNTYQVVQKPQHRLQPPHQQSPSPIISNDASSGSYPNRDFHLQSNIDDDSQQTERPGTTRLLLDDTLWKALSKATSNDRPVAFLVSNPNTNKITINPPVVDRTYDNNRHLKITSFFKVANSSQFDQLDNWKDNNVAGGLLAFSTERTYRPLPRLEQLSPSETLQPPRLTPQIREKIITNNVSATNLINAIVRTPSTTTAPSTASTTTPKPMTRLKLPTRDADDFRIIVDPAANYKKLTATAKSFNSFTTPAATKVTPASSSYKSSPSFIFLGEKFSSQQRSQFKNFTYTPYASISTATIKSTTPLSHAPSYEPEKFRRFYIPRSDSKLPLSSASSTSSTLSFPHRVDQLGTSLKPPPPPPPSPASPSTPSHHPSTQITTTAAAATVSNPSTSATRKLSTTAKPARSEYYEDEEDQSPRNSKAVNTKGGNDTLKLYEDNEIVYYDDYYYDDDDDDDDEVASDNDKNNDNYIDNKILEFTTRSSATDLTVRKSTKPSSKINESTKSVITSTTATHFPKISTPRKSITTTTSASSPSSSSSSSSSPSSSPHPHSYTDYQSSTISPSTKGIQRVKDSNAQRCPQCNEKPYVRGRNRGSITYTTGSNEYDSVTSAGGSRTRPTLKPSTSIVSKSSEGVDIYKNLPRRPDPVYPTPQVDKAAAKCRKDICLLPDCYCGGKDIPGDLPVEETPQIVLLTFDDSVNELNKGLYSDLFEKGRVNPNGCPISATFYVSHEWTDYSMVQNLYATGHEIASHSVSHSFGEQFSQRKWTKEIVGQREILSAYGGVRQDDIRGMRAPFLAVGGNKMFKMLYDANFTYDSSMPIYENRPPSWPYTMDYKLFHDCMIPPCPTRSYPGVWEVPMVMWQDLNGGRCSMGDACSNPPTADGVYKMLIKNFERHFTTNRSPFGLFYHSSWFTQPHHKEGFLAFLDTIVNMPEVWLVTNWQAIQWTRDPTPISRLNQFAPFGCDYPERPKRCNNPKVCNLWHKSGVRYLKTCQPCPDVYPWTGKTGVRNSRVDNDDTLTE